jgi:putative transposase
MTNTNHNLPVALNLLKQDFTAMQPNQEWVGDIMYLWSDEGLYLATVIDLYSRRVVGWSMAERMTAAVVCDALRMALWRRRSPEGVIFHSDRGGQYCSGDFQRQIKTSKLLSSTSAKGNCYEWAAYPWAAMRVPSVSFTLKVEAIHGERFTTRQQEPTAVFDYIETDYNRARRHSANGNQPGSV